MAIVNGTPADDTLDAADGVSELGDHIYGLDGNDTIFGLDGRDNLYGGAGADYLDGGDGDDWASYGASPAAVFVSLMQGTGLGGDAEGDTLVSIEHLFGSGFDDLLVGDGDSNVFRGHGGHDTLKGWGGEDLLMGDAGNDVLQGGAGADTLDGGTGVDTAAYGKSTQGVTVDLMNGLASGGNAEGDTFVSIENITGSHHDDTLVGDNGDNVLKGQEGHDTLKGVGGTDFLWGGGGDDNLYGGNGIDTLRGEIGDDTLDGGYGLDSLYGGADADAFVWHFIEETSVSKILADVIWDFNAAEGDRIALSAIDADVYAGGNQTFTFIGDAAFSGTPGEINYVHSGGNTYIQMQTGTSADVEGVIRLAGIFTPEASWFVL